MKEEFRASKRRTAAYFSHNNVDSSVFECDVVARVSGMATFGSYFIGAEPSQGLTTM